MSHTDVLNRYLFDNKHARGELVQLEESFQHIIANHDYDNGVKNLLGELLAATCLLTATLKFKGEITVQLQGDGPIDYMVINGNEKQQMRGIAKIKESTQLEGLQALIGKGVMIITIRPDQGEPYQGVVALEKPTLAACLANYFETSDQIPTSIWLFTDLIQGKVGGSLIQLLPDGEDKAQQLEDYEHLCQLTNTIKAEEVFSLPAQDLLYRLYHQEEVRIFDPQTVSYQCTCSEEKCLTAISQFSVEELTDILAQEGSVSITCDYCITTYAFDQEKLAPLLDITKH